MKDDQLGIIILIGLTCCSLTMLASSVVMFGVGSACLAMDDFDMCGSEGGAIALVVIGVLAFVGICCVSLFLCIISCTIELYSAILTGSIKG